MMGFMHQQRAGGTAFFRFKDVGLKLTNACCQALGARGPQVKSSPRHQLFVIFAATVRKLRRAKLPEGARSGDFGRTVGLRQAEWQSVHGNASCVLPPPTWRRGPLWQPI